MEVTKLEKNTTLADFEPKRIEEKKIQKNENMEIMSFLGRFNEEMLLDGMREGHPQPEWGDGKTWRYYYIQECKRRGIRLLEQLGWPSNEDALYVNIHTGSVESLIDIATTYKAFADRASVSSQVWSILEHWEPYDSSRPNQYLVDYLKREIEEIKLLKQKKRKDAYERGEISRLSGYEKEIEAEEAKAS